MHSNNYSTHYNRHAYRLRSSAHRLLWGTSQIANANRKSPTHLVHIVAHRPLGAHHHQFVHNIHVCARVRATRESPNEIPPINTSEHVQRAQSHNHDRKSPQIQKKNHQNPRSSTMTQTQCTRMNKSGRNGRQQNH